MDLNEIDVLKDFILKGDHPCIMAKSLVKMNRITVDSYDNFNTLTTYKALNENIKHYLDNRNSSDKGFYSYIAMFPNDFFKSEVAFEDALWKLLMGIVKLDDQPWDTSVSNNPKDDDFSFSIKGSAFYIVGMHPKNSRNARKTPFPLIVFNLHSQFERLRDEGLYYNVRNSIRGRDLERNGSINPVLRDFGTSSEALQYSGKNNTSQWECPFKPSI